MQKEHNQAILSPSPSVGKKKSDPLLSFKQKHDLLIVHKFTTHQIDLYNVKRNKFLLFCLSLAQSKKKIDQNAKRT